MYTVIYLLSLYINLLSGHTNDNHFPLLLDITSPSSPFRLTDLMATESHLVEIWFIQLMNIITPSIFFKITILSAHNSFADNKVHGANMGPTWVLSAPDGPHVGPMNLAIWVACYGEMCSFLLFTSNLIYLYMLCNIILHTAQPQD